MRSRWEGTHSVGACRDGVCAGGYSSSRGSDAPRYTRSGTHGVSALPVGGANKEFRPFAEWPGEGGGCFLGFLFVVSKKSCSFADILLSNVNSAYKVITKEGSCIRVHLMKRW